jgi:hypothetical protein
MEIHPITSDDVCNRKLKREGDQQPFGDYSITATARSEFVTENYSRELPLNEGDMLSNFEQTIAMAGASVP